MPTLELTNFNIVVSVLGAWVSLFGLVSYLCKEDFYLSEALISLLVGVAVSPVAANFIRPIEYAGSAENVADITLSFSRLVLGVQLVLAGVQLPSRYLKKQWKPLAILLGPVMIAMWLATGLLVWALVPGLSLLHSLAVAACVTPTDPILSNVIVSGKFADHNLPRELQRIIVAESGANDGLGYPFLFFALYLIKYTGAGAASAGLTGGAREAMGLWFGEMCGYTILLSVVYGAVVGWVAKELLHWAEERKYVDRESFLVFAISLALFIVGTCGMIGSDDVLACFIAGNAFTWDDWFRLETMDDSLQPTIDMLLNVSIFMWYGAVAPWESFRVNDVVPLYRLVLLGVLVLVLRRLPWILAVHKLIPQIEEIRQALFVGYFGPIGVSAVFYLYITLGFLQSLDVDGETRSDVVGLGETVNVVVWFLVICSVVVHGLSIPLAKLGFSLPETISRTISRAPSAASGDRPPFDLSSRITTLVPDSAMPSPMLGTANNAPVNPNNSGSSSSNINSSNPGLTTRAASPTPATQPRTIYKIGGSIIPRRPENDLLPTYGTMLSRASTTAQPGTADDAGGGSLGRGPVEASGNESASNSRQEGRPEDGAGDRGGAVREPQQSASSPGLPSRTITFVDDAPVR